MSMIKIKTSELAGRALAWAVARCEGYIYGDAGNGLITLYEKGYPKMSASCWHPEELWQQAGPIIERENIDLRGPRPVFPQWTATIWDYSDSIAREAFYAHGPTPMVAAMRCFVYSKMRGKVEVPEELLK